MLTPWPPLRGGSARRRWGRELYGCPKYFGLWQGSLPPPLRGTSLAEGGFSTRWGAPLGHLFLYAVPLLLANWLQLAYNAVLPKASPAGLRPQARVEAQAPEAALSAETEAGSGPVR